MNAFLLLATQASDRTDLLTNGSYQVAGLVVVMLSLGLMAVLVEILGRLLRARPRTQPAPSVSATGAAEAAGVPPETLAAIAAAVAVTVKSPHRIVKIQPSSRAWLQAWSLEGRRQIFQSHTLR